MVENNEIGYLQGNVLGGTFHPRAPGQLGHTLVSPLMIKQFPNNGIDFDDIDMMRPSPYSGYYGCHKNLIGS